MYFVLKKYGLIFAIHVLIKLPVVKNWYLACLFLLFLYPITGWGQDTSGFVEVIKARVESYFSGGAERPGGNRTFYHYFTIVIKTEEPVVLKNLYISDQCFTPVLPDSIIAYNGDTLSFSACKGLRCGTAANKKALNPGPVVPCGERVAFHYSVNNVVYQQEFAVEFVNITPKHEYLVPKMEKK